MSTRQEVNGEKFMRACVVTRRPLQGISANYPIIGDAVVRILFMIGQNMKIQLMLNYPARNFDEALRMIDSTQLAADQKVLTQASWGHGDDVIKAGTISDEDAKRRYPNGWRAMPYGRTSEDMSSLAPPQGRVASKSWWARLLDGSVLAIRHMWHAYCHWRARHAMLMFLHTMDERTLRDFSVTREEMHSFLDKQFTRARCQRSMRWAALVNATLRCHRSRRDTESPELSPAAVLFPNRARQISKSACGSLNSI
jgi:uncharacterized protein YjiS (DUF1127 family)